MSLETRTTSGCVSLSRQSERTQVINVTVMEHEPDPKTRKVVETLAGYGIRQDDIARTVGVAPKTLRKHYADELAAGATKANTQVVAALFRKAIGNGPQSVTAAIFWVKTRLGWKETQVHEHTGADGGPIETTNARSKLADLIARRSAGERPR